MLSYNLKIFIRPLDYPPNLQSTLEAETAEALIPMFLNHSHASNLPYDPVMDLIFANNNFTFA